jgi:tRNA pseudouridine55 synthase
MPPLTMMRRVNKPSSPKKLLNGWLNLYKPLEISSAQAVGRAKRLTQAAKMGHAGTLDPLADGVLPLALGEATKAVSFLMNARKTYRFTIRWGEATTTDDREGEVITTHDHRPQTSDIHAILPQFMGTILQVPPAYSALKVGGQRAYDLARSGADVTLAARNITIHRLELLGQPSPDVAEFRVECGKGTYVRSLARDIALKLGTCGHVAALTREVVGRFTFENAISLDFLEKIAHNPSAYEGDSHSRPWLLPIVSVLDDILALEMTGENLKRLRHGQAVQVSADLVHDASVVVLDHGEMAALCTAQRAGAGFNLSPKRIFNCS